MEQLEADLAAVLNKLGHKSSVEALNQHKKTNTSSRMSAAAYYDEESAALVAERERLIVERFAYQSPIGSGV